MAKRLGLIDGNNIFLRARAALRDLQTSDGTPTAGVFGSIQAYIALQKQFELTDMVWAFDWGRSKYRLGVRSAYKSNRLTEDREDVAPQFGLLEEFLRIVDTPYIRIEGIEGDDIIASLALNSQDPVYIVSSDHDLAQLVTSTISIVKPSIGGFAETVLGPKEVYEKYGWPPARLAELWALQGDPGDGIEGIPKVGPKTALKMLKEHGSLQRVVACDPRCNGYERRVIENYKMIDLHGSSGINITPDFETSIKRPFPEELRDFFVKLEMNSLVRRFDMGTLWE